MAEAIILHHPLPVGPGGTSGSQVRSFHIFHAFRELGWDVWEVSGYARRRIEAIKSIKRALREGKRFQFAYAESSSMPTLFTEPHHLPLHPFLDFGFFNLLRSRAIPIGLFYRDIFWRSSVYREWVKGINRVVALWSYRLELKRYSKVLDCLFLPSLAMRAAFPASLSFRRCEPLPPGCELHHLPRGENSLGGKLRCFYVGGILPPLYDLRPMVQAVSDSSGVELVISCRAADWTRARAHYKDLLGASIRVVHVSGKRLAEEYAAADVFLFYRRPHPYWELTLPLKIVEALGFGLPVIVGSRSETSRFVVEQDSGWVVPNEEALRQKLVLLRDDRVHLERKRIHLNEQRHQHSWQARARKVGDVLTGSSRLEVAM